VKSSYIIIVHVVWW